MSGAINLTWLLVVTGAILVAGVRDSRDRRYRGLWLVAASMPLYLFGCIALMNMGMTSGVGYWGYIVIIGGWPVSVEIGRAHV